MIKKDTTTNNVTNFQTGFFQKNIQYFNAILLFPTFVLFRAIEPDFLIYLFVNMDQKCNGDSRLLACQ